jgi:MoaA/NifB/PqqE/SkfB family radical SAM enzyme
MLDRLSRLRERHGIESMLWMGGEPLLRPDVLAAGTRLFASNTIATNGTRDLLDIPNCSYVVSIDGPREVNDAIRGEGSFRQATDTLSRIPRHFGHRVMCQCVVTRQNEDSLEELVRHLESTRADGLTFSFYVPRRNDASDLTWGSLERRDRAVREVMRLKRTYPHVVRNKRRSLELMLSENARAVTDDCHMLKTTLPLYLGGDDFVTPFCCYGNDVDCDLCGAWAVFHGAARMEEGKYVTADPGDP